MKVHKRKKNSRLRGARTAGWGFRQSHKGHGSKGGFGKAGTGKRADHKKQTAIASDPKGGYFGKQGITSRRTAKRKYNKINLGDIRDNFFKKDGDKLDFSKHKILGSGVGFKAEIKAKSATKAAVSKMEKAGGSILLPVVKSKERVVEKEDDSVKISKKGSDEKDDGEKKE